MFNAGNWLGIENSVRAFVEDRVLDLEIYSGVHGVMELDNADGDKVEIWLNPTGDQLPVPRSVLSLSCTFLI